MNCKKKFTLLLSASALSIALMLPGADTSYAASGNDFNVNTGWTMTDNIATKYTVKNGAGAFSTGNSKIGDIGVTATFVKQADRNDGASYLSDNGNNQAAYGATAGMFYGNPDPGSIPALGMNTQPSNGCGGPLGSWEKYNADGEYEVGSVTFKFDKKVTDPILDLSGLGGYVSRVGSYLSNGQMILVGLGSFNSTNLHLATEGITLENVASNSNLTADNNIIQVKDRNTHTRAVVDNGGYNWIQFQDGYGNQYNVNSPSLVPAGTGSVRLKGTFDKVTFKLYHQATPYSKFSQAKYKTHSSYFANQIGGDPANGDGINGMNVINTESVHIGGQWFNGDQNWDLFRASLRLPKPSSIGDKVWLDGNKDGIQDSTEKPASGVTVKLLDKDGNPVKDFNGNPVKDQVTDENGNYKFENLAAGDYIVEIVPKDGQKLTIKGAGTNATADSDFDSETNKSDSITLEPNQEKTDIDAGLVEEDTYKVVYKFEPSDDGVTPKELPEEVKKQLPDSVENKKNGEKVDSPEKTTFKNVETDEGTWSFENWEKDSVTINKDTIGEDRTEEVIGYWKFTPKAKEYKVTHEFKSGTKGKELPKEVLELVPENQTGKKDGDKVTPTQPAKTEVPVEGGKWVFKNYDKKDSAIDKADEHFVGTWVFTPDAEVVTEYVDEDGKTIAPKEDGTKDKKDIKGYEFVKTEKDEKGNTKHIYKKKTTPPTTEVVTKFVDENGNPLAKNEDGTKDKKDIPGYEFVKTINDKDGNVVHVYRFKQTPSPTVETRYFDTEGNQILADKSGTHDPSTIEGYQFVRTEKDEKGNTVHIYQKLAPVPEVETRYVDENGNQLLPPKEGEQGSVAIDGYNYIRTSKDDNGNTIHTYSKTPFEGVETRYVDTEGNQILADKAGENPASTIEGYQFVRTEKDDKGNITHIYQKTAPTVKVETRYIDENGNQLLPPKEGTQNQVNIEGYVYVSTNNDNNGNTIHIYKKVIKPIEDVVTKFVDENGNEIAQTQKGKNPSQNIEGYEIITTKTDDKGNIIYVYRKKPDPIKVVTKFVDEKGNTIAESEDGKKPNKDIKGYEFVKTETDKDGNTVHIYKKKTTPPTEVVTEYVDENGKTIAPKENGTKDKKDIKGYEFVKTEKDEKGNTKHIYKKVKPTPKVVTEYVDEDGNTISDKENGTKDKKDIKGYEFVKTEKDEQGNTKHIYKKVKPTPEVVTEYVDEDGNTISDKENGTKDKKDIKGYEFVETKKDEQGNTKHIYKKKTTPTPEVVTEFVDEDGKTIAPKENGTKDKKDIEGYEFVETKKDEQGNTKHIYKKKTTPTPEVVTEFVDEDGKTIAPKENGTKDKKDIKGYEFVETKTDEQGNTKHIYKKVKPTPKVVTEYVDEDGNTISDKENGTKDKKDIEGYEFVKTEKDKDGNTVHIYKKKETPTVGKITKYVDENGNKISESTKGENPKKDIDGYEFVKTEKDKDGNTVHIYKKKDSQRKNPAGKAALVSRPATVKKGGNVRTGVGSSLGALVTLAGSALALFKSKKRK